MSCKCFSTYHSYNVQYEQYFALIYYYKSDCECIELFYSFHRVVLNFYIENTARFNYTYGMLPEILNPDFKVIKCLILIKNKLIDFDKINRNKRPN